MTYNDGNYPRSTPEADDVTPVIIILFGVFLLLVTVLIMALYQAGR